MMVVVRDREATEKCRGSNAAEHGETAKRKRAMMVVVTDIEVTENPME